MRCENAASEQAHPLTYGIFWIDEASGWPIATDEELNLAVREELVALGNEPGVNRDDILATCRSSVHFWLNYFGWTYNLKVVDDDGNEVPAMAQHVPFQTWPVQDAALRDIIKSIDTGEDIIIDKSRDMGASWLCVAVSTWYWLFRNDAQVLMASRIEDLVDRRGDPDSLFWKVDYMLESLPDWMLPGDRGHFMRGGACRSHMQLINPTTNATISGQATTGHVGRGGRRTFVLFDEMAAMDHATDAWRSAADTSACRIGNSTPIGPGTEFTKQRNAGLIHGRPKIVTLGYWDHPTKGANRTWMVDEDGDITNIAGRGYWSTPWFRQQVERRQDPSDIGQNILIDHTTSGDLFFNSSVVTKHLQMHGRDAKRCEIEDGKMVDCERGRWFIWCDMLNGRPDLETNFCMFADLSQGRGSSNTAVAVMDRETGEFVAEFVDPHTSPFDVAEEICLAGRTVWRGQNGEAFLGWEVNGPGEAFYQDVQRQNYSYIYYRRQLGKRTDRRTRDYGWRSDRRSKRILLSGLSREINASDITICSREGMGEMLDYVFFADGSIGPGHLQDETTGARESHGDRVIAYAGAVFMREEAPHFDGTKPMFKRNTLGDILGHAEVLDG